MDTLGDLLGVDAVVRMLAAHAEGALQQHGVHSVAAQAALDSALFVLGSMSGLLEACCSERSRQDPLPDWLAGAHAHWNSPAGRRVVQSSGQQCLFVSQVVARSPPS